jgi:peptidoglycan/LPS O-acetylase OafA/YrhL
MPQAGTPKPSARYDSLDAWRGIACLLVVVFHVFYATWFEAGNQSSQAYRSFSGLLVLLASKFSYGVTLFFVISGYCISATVDASARRQTPIADYFRRRVRRIFPPFWVFIVLTALGIALVHALGDGRLFWEVPADGVTVLGPPSALTAGQWLRNLTLTEIWLARLFGEGPHFLEGTGHAWTLAYEEQFYAVCGLLRGPRGSPC